LKSSAQIRRIAQSVIGEELEAIGRLSTYIDSDFVSSVKLIYQSTGRVVVTGIGKSANIGSKIVATLNSTGTPAVFMHAADAIHGDLGTIRDDDVIICLSNSGNTPEIKVLVPLLKLRGNRLIAFVGNTDSYLARQADYVIRTTVDHEATPDNLMIPTSSTTAQVVMGDALAISILECRGYTAKDFAAFHPGGTIGKKLYLRVRDLYLNNEVPRVRVDQDIRSTILEISSRRLGVTAVLDKRKLVGVITDGDLRRMLQKYTNIDDIRARDIMTRNPRTVDPDTLVVDALRMMEQNNITQLLVMKGKEYVGVIHLHDILKEGIL
jgi:arabinose-5-phosphate isomerase